MKSKEENKIKCILIDFECGDLTLRAATDKVQEYTEQYHKEQNASKDKEIQKLREALNASQFKPQEDTATPEELAEARETYDKFEKDHLIGKTFEIADNTGNHRFKIGEKVKVLLKSKQADVWLVITDWDGLAWVTKKDLGL